MFYGSDTAEDEHRFVFDCSVSDRFISIFWGPAPAFVLLHDPRVIAKFLHKCFADRSRMLQGLFRGAAALVAIHNLQLIATLLTNIGCTIDNSIECLFQLKDYWSNGHV